MLSDILCPLNWSLNCSFIRPNKKALSWTGSLIDEVGHETTALHFRLSRRRQVHRQIRRRRRWKHQWRRRRGRARRHKRRRRRRHVDQRPRFGRRRRWWRWHPLTRLDCRTRFLFDLKRIVRHFFVELFVKARVKLFFVVGVVIDVAVSVLLRTVPRRPPPEFDHFRTFNPKIGQN